jgi:general secretion pathway protein H
VRGTLGKTLQDFPSPAFGALSRKRERGKGVLFPIPNLQSPIPAFPAGFTLIEILVVLLIIAVLAAALVIAAGGSSERQLANAAERFQMLLGHACGEAELTGREIGAVVAADGYTFKRLDGDLWNIMDGELRPRRWPDGARLQFTRDGRPLELAAPERDTPQIVCFSSGELTPFALTLALGDNPLRYRLRGSDDGTLNTERIQSP